MTDRCFSVKESGDIRLFVRVSEAVSMYFIVLTGIRARLEFIIVNI